MKFRFTHPADTAKYGDVWIDASGMQLSAAIVLAETFGGMTPKEAGEAAKAGNAVVGGFLVWAAVKRAGLTDLDWGEFDFDLAAVEFDGPTEPEQAPEDVSEGTPGVDPTSRSASRRGGTSKR